MLSVIITTYNRPVMLKQAIESVLSQNFSSIEVIVVDDNSTMDNSFCVHLVDKYIKNETNKGLGENHKIGFANSSGEYVCFMDDDDYYIDSDYFAKAIKMMENDSEVTMVCGSSNNLFEPSLKLEPILLDNPSSMNSMDYLEEFGLKYRKPQSTFTTIFRRDSLLKAGFNKMRKPTDTCLYLRALTVEGKVLSINTPIGNYRIHEKQMTKAQNCDFIIEVLTEKYVILGIVKNKILTPPQWWYRQFRITFDYYYNSKPSKAELYKVLIWSLFHSYGCIDMIKYVLKLCVKSIY